MFRIYYSGLFIIRRIYDVVTFVEKNVTECFFFFEFGFLDRVIVVYLVMRNLMNLIFNFFFMLNIIFSDSFFFG